VERVADSCGYSVPQLDLVGERSMLDDHHGRRTTEQWVDRPARNAVSIDGLPALEAGHPSPLAPTLDHDPRSDPASRPRPEAEPQVSAPAAG
jgi:hypothetical protein